MSFGSIASQRLRRGDTDLALERWGFGQSPPTKQVFGGLLSGYQIESFRAAEIGT